LDHEHSRLAGFACYIEEIKDPREYAEHWADYANEHKDHTAEEWREYYETQIRPARFETGTAQPVHMHSYSMDEVKQYDIPTAVQPVDSPLQQQQQQQQQHSQQASPKPVSRWPAPEPRPYMRSSYAGSTYQSYEVTHFPASKDIGLRRTVLVSNIPVGMALANVFAELQSDRILETKFAGTAGMKTIPPIMTNMAIVEFIDNEDAQMFVDVYSKHEVFDLDLIASPTRPLRRARVDSGYN
jgi:predicted RNA-binding protein